jgi:hypothetical protein
MRVSSGVYAREGRERILTITSNDLTSGVYAREGLGRILTTTSMISMTFKANHGHCNVPLRGVPFSIPVGAVVT